jgi:hypothetical protein
VYRHHIGRAPGGTTLEAGPLFDQRMHCALCALRLVRLLIHSPDWVHRRVERVTFRDDRTVTRQVSVDLTMPTDVPVVEFSKGDAYRIIPLTVMRRKTLVNFSLSAAGIDQVSMLGLRQNQALVAALLQELALGVLQPDEDPDGPTPSLHPDTTTFIRAIAEGDQGDLAEAFKKLEDRTCDAQVTDLMEAPRFRAIANRLVDNFILMVLVPENCVGRLHIRFSYDEALSLKPRQSDWFNRKAPGDGSEPRRRKDRSTICSNFLLQPVAVRFPVPAAENAESFHFEVEAPPDVHIKSATIIAGRPGDSRRPSWDHVRGGYAVVGLHVVGVQPGSQSQAQVMLGVTPTSWLGLNTIASILNASLVAIACVLIHQDGDLGTLPTSKEDLATWLLAVSGAVWAVVNRPDKHRMASRLLRGLRLLAFVSAGLPVVAAALYSSGWAAKRLVLYGALGVAVIVAVGFVVAWFKARDRDHDALSPWEQGYHVVESEERSTLRLKTQSWEEAVMFFGFDKPAVKVASAEGVHSKRDLLTLDEQGDLSKLVDARLAGAQGAHA